MAIPAIDRNVFHMQVKACFKLPVIADQRDVMASAKSARKAVSSSDGFHTPSTTYLKAVGVGEQCGEIEGHRVSFLSAVLTRY